ncbi:dTDP-glucose 4,6-dehydratase [Paractinoplanes ferrugineus]|uniref:dTDP-glucose 4,6-dehydratase n=1 Tax=Paractinoplanes ferrugineus TaxID=113564 RepID=A0A919IYJ8_9ACTN|nr:GDP-mannose 4,6-dehydratase [Actinoplanes ferrugineus]GIE11200.1 dTDP-glucose 4,6-dehydratase [Actinoplanes ferrugineus]
MNLLVTGGAGFIGSHFVRAVLADRLPGLAGASVTVLDKMTYAGNFANLGSVVENDRLDFVPADTTDAPVVDAAFRGHDAVVHFSAVGHPADVTGIKVLLEARRHHVSRFLHVSTSDVYGSIDTGAWTERSPLAPSTPRAAAKAGADLMALAFHRAHGLPVVVTRGSDTYGAFQHPARTVPRLVTSLLDGRPATLRDGGTRVRDRLHVADHCRGLALALTDGRPGEVYHVAGSVELAERDLVELIRTELGLDPSGPDSPAPAAGFPRAGDHRRALDDDKIRQELGWRPRVEFTTGLASTIAWYRDNPTWWRPLLPD